MCIRDSSCPDPVVVPTCTDVVYVAGSYATENSFTITDCDGNILASMDAGVGSFETACLELPADYVVSLVDSYGDGWNGGVLYVGDDMYDLPSDGWAITPEGTSNSWTIGSCGVAGCTDDTACNFDAAAGATFDDGSCLYDLGCGCGEPAAAEGYDCDGNFLCDATTVTMGGGSWIGETSWSITDCDGNIVAEGAGAASTSCVDLPEVYTVTMTDSYGDGWNGNVLNIGGTEYAGPGAELSLIHI